MASRLNHIITYMFLKMNNMDKYIDIMSMRKTKFAPNSLIMDIHMDIVSMIKPKAWTICPCLKN